MEVMTLQMYWGQYRILEKRLIEMSDYVMISPKNYPTYSNQFISMYLTICSEIDSLADDYCKELGVNDKERFGINNKINCILDKYPKMKSWKCKTKFPFDEIHLVPFAKFNDNQSSDWWKAYNLIKHKRTDKGEDGLYNYQRANLKNILTALSALFIMLSKTKQELCAAFPIDIESKLFEIDFIM